MRVLVCGGRDFTDRALVFRTLDRIHRRYGIECIVHGGARGADSFADAWAHKRFTDAMVWAAEWKRLGIRAGAFRNEHMLRRSEPHVVVAFPGGRGTKDMVTRAAKVTAVVEVSANGHRTTNYAPTRELYARARDMSIAILKPLAEEKR